jgi:hypothetical protein
VCGYHDAHTHHRQDLYERRVKFVLKMREKHPTMPPTFEEELAAGVESLKRDRDLRKREGLIEEAENQ